MPTQSNQQKQLFLLLLLPLTLAYLTVIFLKWRLLYLSGFRVLSRQLGRVELADITLLETILLFRNDYLVFVGISLVLYLFSFFLHKKIFALLVCILSNLIFFISYLQIKSMDNVGTFLSWKVLSSAFETGVNNFSIASDYLSSSEISKILMAMVVLIIFSVVPFLVIPYLGKLPRVSWSKLSQGYLYLAIATSLLFSLLPSPSTTFHSSLLWQATTAYFANRNLEFESRLGLSDSKTIRSEYLKLVYDNKDNSKLPIRYFGQARDYDLILIILETIPTKLLDLNKDLSAFPNLAFLKEGGLVKTKHYTTYPYTSRAFYSILTSCYPGNSIPPWKKTSAKLPGLISSLSSLNYRSGIYLSSSLDFENDESLFSALGFETIFSSFKPERSLERTASTAAYNRRVAADKRSLAKMLHDIEAWTATGERYVALWQPQLAHAPWLSTDSSAGASSAKIRGQSLLPIHDKWFGQVIQRLRASARLDRTLILVTSDHGVRTRSEDPQFEGGIIDRYTFEVPFLLYLPGILNQEILDSSPSSHIDISPTLLSLIGAKGNPLSEQGISLFQEPQPQRKIFLLAADYLGADGYLDEKGYYMINYSHNLAYENTNTLDFSESSISGTILRGEPLENVREVFSRMTAINGNWNRVVKEQQSILGYRN